MKHHFYLLDIEYTVENDRPIVRLWGKTDSGKSIIVLDETFRPYFYVEPKEPGIVNDLVKKLETIKMEGETVQNVEVVKRTMLGKEKTLLKVTIKIPANVPKFRDVVKEWPEVRNEYEYGISFHKRYIIDKGIIPMNWVEVDGEEIETDIKVDLAINAAEIKSVEKDEIPKPKILAFDIEVIENVGIIMISLMTSSGFKKVISYGGKTPGVEIVSNEKEMIEKFIEYVKGEDPDIVVTFNGDRYDFLRLEESAKKYGIELDLGRDKKEVLFGRRALAAKIRGRVHLDIYNFVDHVLSSNLSTEVLSLDRVAKEILGKGKMDIEWPEIEKSWKEGKIKRIADYCLNDSFLTIKLAEHLLPQAFELSKVTGQTLFDVSRMSYSQLVEWLLIRRAFEKNILVENRPKYDEIMRRRKATSYEGGYVLTPKEGIHEKIALFDFRSLYPSIIVTHNISPDTLECSHSDCKKNRPLEEEHAHHFCRNKKGFVSEVIKELIEKRIEVKNKMRRAKPRSMKYKNLYGRQYALKILANASYGYYAYPGSRWYSKICAETAASFGRMYIKKVNAMAEKKFDVVYGDTDSLFLKVNSRQSAIEFMKKVNRYLPGIIEFTLQGIYVSGIFVSTKAGTAAKKRYALLDKDGKMVIRGFEKVRKDWANIAKDTQEKVLFAILKDRDPEKAVKIVRDILQELEKGKVPEKDLVIYTQITRPLDEYEQIGPHVSAAKRAAKRGKSIKAGTTIGYIITKGSGSISDRAEIIEFAKEPDTEYYKNNQILPAALRVLSGLGIDEDDILRGKTNEQLSLEKYIKK
ncbi:MAG: ribonuclease H-like domain-containing protein [Candidatus Aenigmarchaeota archaeon]|nr:ribonuclease H-like domain-containing protein [Candidatus Aenigmarchaeota archaeon]